MTLGKKSLKNKVQTNNSYISEKNGSNISQDLFDQLLNPTLDLSIDYAEFYIDDLIQNELIKEIPVIKTVVGTIKGGIAINQFWFAKKLLVFIREFNQKTISQNKLEAFKSKLNHDPKFQKKVAERLMVFIDRNIEITQTKIIANLFKAYVDEKIDYNQFNNILITLDNLNPKTFNFFFDLEKLGFIIDNSNYNTISERNFEMETLIVNSGFGEQPSPYFSGFKLTEEGKKLFDFGIKPIM